MWNLLSRWMDQPTARRTAALADPMLRGNEKHTELAVKCALGFAWQTQTQRFGFIEHSARVAALSRAIAERMGMAPEDIALTEHAAQLHEIGMVAVPPSLISTPRPLTTEELARVRAQAWIGAAIIRTSYEPVKADLVEHQYADFAELRRHFPDEYPALLSAGILRVADLFDTLTHPRPYQRGIPKDRWIEVLQSGTGSQFHPQAAGVLLSMTLETEAFRLPSRA